MAIPWVAFGRGSPHNGAMRCASTAGLVCALVLLASTARAEPVVPQAAAESQLRYAGYIAGLNVFTFYVTTSITAERYRVQTRYHTDGLVSAFVPGELHALAEGGWKDGRALPSRYQTWGIWRDEARDTQIDYASGRPVIRKLIPPIERERDVVPLSELPGSIDTLSALADLAHQISETGRCPATARLFDGRRLSTVAVTDGGDEQLASATPAGFAGRALRCDISTRQIGGFLAGERAAEPARPATGSLWFARLGPAAMLVPVRMSFDLHLLGHATLYLAQAY